MLRGKFFHTGYFFNKFIPYISVIPYIYIKSSFSLFNVWNKMLNDLSEDFLLSSGSADGQKKSHGLAALFP